MKHRESFGGRFAVIMALAGSAIGLGNIWRFPYIVGKNGGAAFIIVYILACVLVALPSFAAEAIIGRRSRTDTYGAMKKLAPGSRWKALGILTVAAPILILSYYSVVGGWSVQYLFKALSFDFSAGHARLGMFSEFISSTWQPILAHTAFLFMVAVIVINGVKNGIEKFSKYAMPALFILIIAIMVYSLTLPGAMKGVQYMVKPDFSKLDSQAIAAALGQAFFSMSLGMGTILTYASYIKKEENLVVSGAETAVSDLAFAMLASFAVIPAVFAAGMEPGAGAGLVFDTLPFIFSKIGGCAPVVSAVVAIVFFLAILVAALTSAISMLEVGVSYMMEEWKMTRTRSVIYLCVIIWAIGVLCSLSFGPLCGVKIFGKTIFDFLDMLCSDWILPFGGLLFAVFVGWKMSKDDVKDEFTNSGTANKGLFGVFYFLIRYVTPLGIGLVFLSAIIR